MPRNNTGDAAGDRSGEPPSADGAAYDPAVLTDWAGNVDPGNVNKALDQIAESFTDHLHDGDTLQHDGVNSNGGAFSFTTTGSVIFNQPIQAAEIESTGGAGGFVIDMNTVGSANVYIRNDLTGARARLDVDGYILGRSFRVGIENKFCDSGNHALFTTAAADALAVNNLHIAHAQTTVAPELSAVGTDANIDLAVTPKGTGHLLFDGLSWPNADGNPNDFLQTNGGGVLSWAAAAGAAHAILDGVTHTDSVAQGVTRGSLICGNATPMWDELVVGYAGQFLKTDATDTFWADIVEADVTDLQAYVLAHAMLDGSAHTDSVADAVTQGSIIYGNTTPKWDELVIGSATKLLFSDGMTLAWQDIDDLTADASPAGATDYVISYDASAGIHKKVLMNNLPGGGAHTHDGDTLQLDGVNSDGGAFTFTTTGTVTFSQALQIALDKKIYFGDTDVYIFSDDDGDADFIADGTITVAGATDTIIGVASDIEIGDGNLRTMKPQTPLKVNLGTVTTPFFDVCASQLRMLERSSDPTEPVEGTAVIWMSDGTGKGDDGDVLIASKAGGATKWATLFDHSAGAAW